MITIKNQPKVSMNLKPKMLRLTLDESPCIYAGLARWELEKLDLLSASYINANVDNQKLKNSISNMTKTLKVLSGNVGKRAI